MSSNEKKPRNCYDTVVYSLHITILSAEFPTGNTVDYTKITLQNSNL